MASYRNMLSVIKAIFTTIFVGLLLVRHANSEQWKNSDQSQVAEDASPGLSSFLEHVLKAQDEINWVKKIAQHEKGASKDQRLQYNSDPVPSSDNFEMFHSDNEYHLDTPTQNLGSNEWTLGSSGESSATDFMYDSGQSQFKSKNTGDRFKRRSSNQLDKDPELKEIVRNNIDNLHMLNFSPEHDTDIHMIAETGILDSNDDTSVERRGTENKDTSEEEPIMEDLSRKENPSDSVIEAYFAAHGKRQASRGRRVPVEHSRDVRIEVPDLFSEADLLKTMSDRSEQEHQRLQLEDADGLLKGTRADTHIGSIDNQMTLDKEKTTKLSNKGKFQTVQIKESKITSRDSQSQDRGLPQQIKLDLLNDPLYNKVDLASSASQNVNIGNDKSEKNLIAPIAAGSFALDNHLLSSVNRYLAGFDQQRQESPNRGASELEGSQIFLDKKDTSGQQVKWGELAVAPQLLMPSQNNPYKMSIDKDSSLSAVPDIDSTAVSNGISLLRLTRSNLEKSKEISGDAFSNASGNLSSCRRSQFTSTNQDLLQTSRGKRTVVKRPGAIWRESGNNEDLEEESDSEIEGKEAISFENDEVDDGISGAVNGAPSKSSVSEANEEKSDQMQDKANNGDVDQEYESDKGLHDDADNLKASFDSSSKSAQPEELCLDSKTNLIPGEKNTGSDLRRSETSDSDHSHLVRSERAIKKTRQGAETGKKSERKEIEGFVHKSTNVGPSHRLKTEKCHIDDAARLKASFKSSSNCARLPEAKGIQEPVDTRVTSDSEDSQYLENEQAIKVTHRDVGTSAVGAEGVMNSKDDVKPELNPNKYEKKSSKFNAEDLFGDMPDNSENLNMHRELKENPLTKSKSHFSRSLLSFYEPLNENKLIPPIQKLCHVKVEDQKEEEEAGCLEGPLSSIIDRELRSGNLPPLIRVKRSVSEADFVGTDEKSSKACKSTILDAKQASRREKPERQSASKQDQPYGNAEWYPVMPSANEKGAQLTAVDSQLSKQGASNQEPAHEDVKRSADEGDWERLAADGTDADQEALFEKMWDSGTTRTKRARIHAKRNHGRGRPPTARDASSNEAEVGKGVEKGSRDRKSEWKIKIRSTKHARLTNEDEDEKEFESADLNVCPTNITVRAADSSELYLGDKEKRELGDVRVIFPINDHVDETEDENEFESSAVEKDKDYDVVRRHVQHSFKKRHPANKVDHNANSDKARIKDVVKHQDKKEEKGENVMKNLSEDRYKRASNYGGTDTDVVKSNSLSMHGSNIKEIGSTNLLRNSQIPSNLNFNSPYENVKKLEDHPLDLNSLAQESKIMNQRLPNTQKSSLELSAISKDKGIQSFTLPSSDLREIHEMRLGGAKLSDSAAFGIDLTSNVPQNNGDFGDKMLLAPIVNERASSLYARCAEKCTSSSVSPDAKKTLFDNLSCSTGCPVQDDQPRSQRQADCHHSAANAPKHNQLEESQSDEYKGELDDGQLGIEIVQAIFQQVDKTPCLKHTFSSGLSLRYHPSDIKGMKEYKGDSQQMMHQIMQLIDQSVDEEVKSRTCSSLPDDLEEFMTWLMRNEAKSGSFTEHPFLLESHCAKAPLPRHLGEPKTEEIEHQIALRNNLISEYKKLEKSDQDEVKPIYEYLSEQNNFLKTMLQKSTSKSEFGKKAEDTKSSGSDSDLEQQRLVEETMDSVGLGPNAMHSSNIGDKFISGLGMVDESSGRMNNVNGASLSRRSVAESIQPHLQRSPYDRRPYANARNGDTFPRKAVRNVEDESSHVRFIQNPHRDTSGNRYYDKYTHNGDDSAYDDVEEVVDNIDMRRSSNNLNFYKDNWNRRRSIKKTDFVPSRKYKMLVARAAELRRKKRNALRRKKPVT